VIVIKLYEISQVQTNKEHLTGNRKLAAVMDLRHFFETETFAKTAVKTRDKPRHLGLD